MARRYYPSITTAIRTANTPQKREYLYDTDENRPYAGDGSTAGAKALAYWTEPATVFADGDATPSVADGHEFVTTGSTAITNFDDGTANQVITIYRGDSDIVITDNANIDPIISGNITLSATRPSASFRLVSGVWKEVAQAGLVSTAMTPVVQGSLDNAVATLLATSYVENIAALKAKTGGFNELVYVRGYYTEGDAGGGFYYWDSASSATDDGGAVIAPNTGGTGRWKAIFDGKINARRFGAKGDNGTTDDYAALQAWINYGESVSGCLYGPDGIFTVGTMLVMDGTASIKGESESALGFVLKRKSGAAITSVLRIGAASGQTQVSDVVVEGVYFDGNGGCSEAIVKVYNMTKGALRFCTFVGGVAHGLLTSSDTETINVHLLRNDYDNLHASGNGGDGFRFVGEKDTRFGTMHSHENTGNGFYYKASKDDGNLLAETTTCTLGDQLSRDNGGNGFVFDMVEKYNGGHLTSTLNNGYGFTFRSTLSGASAYGSNSLTGTTMISRNDALGGFRIADDAYVSSMQLAQLRVIGPTMNAGVEGVRISGAVKLSIDDILVENVPGIALRIREGTPFGGAAVQSEGISIGHARLVGCGNSSGGSDGFLIENSTDDVWVGKLHCENVYTTAANARFEFKAANTATKIVIGDATLAPADAGQEASYGTADVRFTGMRRHGATEQAQYLPAGIELGHASDTTVTRHSAGNIQVEGNLLYRAGGTDVPVADGGTGASTEAGACANLGTWRILAASAVQVVHTGTTAETTLATVAVPAGAMGPNGILRITTFWSQTNDASAKTVRIKLGSTTMVTHALASAVASRGQGEIHNRNSASSQVAQSGGGSQGWSNGGSVATGTENTANALNLVITAELADSTDTVNMEYYTVELCYRA